MCSFRKWRLLEEILSPDRIQPDILTVQECDHFTDFFEPALESYGYQGIFFPKKRSPCMRFGYFSDGVAIFWRREIFESLGSPIFPGINDVPTTAFIGVQLRHRMSGKILSVLTCHLKAKQGVDMEAIRQSQIKLILDNLLALGGGEKRFLMMGDFNTTPAEHCIAEKESTTVVQYVQSWNNGCLTSAYPFLTPSVDGSTMSWAYSTWKSRGGKEVQRLIDYIWYSRDYFKVSWIQSVPESKEMEDSRSKLPDIRYPSDHFALCTKFILT